MKSPKLFHTLILGDKASLGIAKDATNDATWCRDLDLFYKLHKGRDDWQSLVRRAYLENGKLNSETQHYTFINL